MRTSVVVGMMMMMMMKAVDVDPPELRQVQGSALRPHQSVTIAPQGGSVSP